MAGPTQREQRKPGLKSIHEAREQRARGKHSRASPNLLLYAVVAIAAILLGYRFFATRQLDRSKEALLSKERAVEVTVGREWFPLRDKIEKFVLDAAVGEWPGDFVDNGAKWDFRSAPGIYLRIRLADARDPTSLHKAAQGSLKDGFVGCLMREPNAGAARGDVDAGPFAEQPWNMRQAYASTRILTADWINDVKASGDDLRLRVFEQQYEKAAREEIPLAIDLIKRAQFFLLVLDEDPPAAKGDGAPLTEEMLQLVPHDARVRLMNLRDGSGTELARMRRRAEGTAISVSGHEVTDPETRQAMQRQVNNCSLALQVQSVLALEKK